METSALFWIVTICSFVTASVPCIVNIVLQMFCQESESERHLRRQIADLRAEQTGIRVVDEFPKYAKIQRKINKVLDELNVQNSIRSTSSLKVKYGATVLLYLTTGVVIVILMWQYGQEPVFEVSPDQLYPIDWLITTKSGDKVGLSMTFWLTVSSTVARIASRSIP